MAVCLDDLGDGFITFPEFQKQLRALERGLPAANAVGFAVPHEVVTGLGGINRATDTWFRPVDLEETRLRRTH